MPLAGALSSEYQDSAGDFLNKPQEIDGVFSVPVLRITGSFLWRDTSEFSPGRKIFLRLSVAIFFPVTGEKFSFLPAT
ncbi:hypothetical protein [Entomohabitans teleogrylli]|uniref:hypothetical protein n=1 Tax=Entomohabitans teleogrylli TaxID=1384589 RepID=UPI0012B699AF|nr:hypothetical protein [Entomohabitans teleogrylli]